MDIRHRQNNPAPRHLHNKASVGLGKSLGPVSRLHAGDGADHVDAREIPELAEGLVAGGTVVVPRRDDDAHLRTAGAPHCGDAFGEQPLGADRGLGRVVHVAAHKHGVRMCFRHRQDYLTHHIFLPFNTVEVMQAESEV